MKKILILILLSILVIGCQPEWNFENSNKVALKHIKGMNEFRNYNAENLELRKYNPLNCEDCWNIVYEFDIETDELPEYITRLGVHLFVEKGKVNKEVVMKLTDNVVSGKKIKVEEVLDQTCEHDYECVIPDEYLTRSSCAFDMKCIESLCAVVCEYGEDPVRMAEQDAIREKKEELKVKIIEKLREDTGFSEFNEKLSQGIGCEGCYLFWFENQGLTYRVSSSGWENFDYLVYEDLMTEETCIESNGEVLRLLEECTEILGEIETEFGFYLCCKK